MLLEEGKKEAAALAVAASWFNREGAPFEFELLFEEDAGFELELELKQAAAAAKEATGGEQQLPLLFPFTSLDVFELSKREDEHMENFSW